MLHKILQLVLDKEVIQNGWNMTVRIAYIRKGNCQGKFSHTSLEKQFPQLCRSKIIFCLHSSLVLFVKCSEMPFKKIHSSKKKTEFKKKFKKLNITFFPPHNTCRDLLLVSFLYCVLFCWFPVSN